MLRSMMFPVCLLLACGGPETAGSPQSAATPATVKTVVQDTGKSAEENRLPSLAAGTTPHSGPVPGPIDPPWFKPTMFPGAAITSSGRTQKDAAGLFSTQMLLALPAGTTREACVDALKAAVAAPIPDLEQKPAKDERITLTGSNADYQVTMICGEAKGTMSAYISYRWLRSPD